MILILDTSSSLVPKLAQVARTLIDAWLKSEICLDIFESLFVRKFSILTIVLK